MVEAEVMKPHATSEVAVDSQEVPATDPAQRRRPRRANKRGVHGETVSARSDSPAAAEVTEAGASPGPAAPSTPEQVVGKSVTTRPARRLRRNRHRRAQKGQQQAADTQITDNQNAESQQVTTEGGQAARSPRSRQRDGKGNDKRPTGRQLATEDGRCYGEFQCSGCSRQWGSVYSYRDTKQRCRRCNIANAPIWQGLPRGRGSKRNRRVGKPMTVDEANEKFKDSVVNQPHDIAHCEVCTEVKAKGIFVNCVARDKYYESQKELTAEEVKEIFKDSVVNKKHDIAHCEVCIEVKAKGMFANCVARDKYYESQKELTAEEVNEIFKDSVVNKKHDIPRCGMCDRVKAEGKFVNCIAKYQFSLARKFKRSPTAKNKQDKKSRRQRRTTARNRNSSGAIAAAGTAAASNEPATESTTPPPLEAGIST